MKADDLKEAFISARNLFEKHCVEDILATIHNCHNAWFEKKLRTGIPFFDSLEAGNTKFYWALAETARYAIFFSYRRNKTSRLYTFNNIDGWKMLKPLLEFVLDKQAAIPFLNSPVLLENQCRPNETFVDMMTSIFYPQYLIERSSPYVFGRALLMYKEAPVRLSMRDPGFKISDYQKLVHHVTDGMGMEKFLSTWFHIYAFSFQHPFMWTENLAPLVNPVYHDYFYYGDLIKRPTHTFVLDMLSAGPNTIRQTMSSEIESLQLPVDAEFGPDSEPSLCSVKALFFSRNPLTTFPLVRTTRDYNECCVAPIPHLVGEWMYNRFFGLLSEEINNMARTSRVVVNMPKLFEEYVGLVADTCTPGGAKWLNEDQMRPCPQEQGRCVIDWAMEFSEYVVMIDAKRANISYDKIYRGFWPTALERCAHVKYQATDFWDGVKKGRVQPLDRAAHKKPIALAVTYADFDFKLSRTNLMDHLTEEERKRFSDDAWVPIIPLSIDQLERLFTMWSTKDRDWLPNFLTKILTDGWSKVYGISGFKAEPHGPLFEKHNAFIQEMGDRLVLAGGYDRIVSSEIS